MAINQAQLFDLLAEYRRENWRGIQTPEWQDRIVRDMASRDEPAILKRIAPYWDLPPEARILVLGSGVGNFVVACRNRGLKAFGIEPDRIAQGASVTSLQIARQRLDSPAFAAALGEQLPFADATFDLVILDQVIEHVSDQTRVLAEAFRVLKPGGAMYVACPNYLRFYEPHYKIWFFPLLPKPLGALYLRLRGRDPVLLKQLKYTTNRRVRKLLKRVQAEHVVDLNIQDFREKCSLESSGFASRKARLVQQLTRTPWLSAPVLRAASFYVRLREGGCEMLALKEA
jgi:ubiquinone/menaquinone biosynthesis C-methylase UbiE